VKKISFELFPKKTARSWLALQQEQKKHKVISNMGSVPGPKSIINK